MKPKTTNPPVSIKMRILYTLAFLVGVGLAYFQLRDLFVWIVKTISYEAVGGICFFCVIIMFALVFTRGIKAGNKYDDRSKYQS